MTDGKYLLVVTFGINNLVTLYRSRPLSEIKICPGAIPIDILFISHRLAVVSNADQPLLQIIHIV